MQPRPAYAWSRFGWITRAAVAGLAVNAAIFFVLASVFNQAWPIVVAAPSALLVLMFVASGFGGPDVEED